jgi:hypothetical protein
MHFLAKSCDSKQEECCWKATDRTQLEQHQTRLGIGWRWFSLKRRFRGSYCARCARRGGCDYSLVFPRLPRTIRAGARFASSSRADLALRGCAISFLTLASVALPDSFLSSVLRHTSVMTLSLVAWTLQRKFFAASSSKVPNLLRTRASQSSHRFGDRPQYQR